MGKEYKYLVVEDHVGGHVFTELLKDGWLIERATATTVAVHYVLTKYVPPGFREPVLSNALPGEDDGKALG